jgi:squalene-hopene/tetraprenyl-beta-curcumene cyclase
MSNPHSFTLASREARNRMSGIRRIGALLIALLPAVGSIPAMAQSGDRAAQADPSAGKADVKPVERASRMTAEGARYLVAAQDKEGGWASETGPGVSGLVLKALIQEPTVGPEHPAVRRGIEFLLRFQHDDGGIYGGDGLHKNYETSVALSAFSAIKGDEPATGNDADKPSEQPERTAAPAPDAELQKRIAAARKFLTENQWDGSENISVDNPWFGGAGYGRGERPDLSNTQLMLDALHDSGLPKDDPAYKKALAFIARCQMLGESNDQPFARGSTDGGFIYSPANGGESKAGEWEVNGHKELRAYGSMTYAGFKSMLYAGLSKDDPRVAAAMGWIRRNWTLEHNPNMPGELSLQGLYYYYHTFARALAAWGEEKVVDGKGVEHDWRAELVEKLAKLQRRDGSWVNEADRWMEGIPELTTAYAVLALQAVYPSE